MFLHRISAMYFSPTGTTRTIVEAVAKGLSDELRLPWDPVDFTPPENRRVTVSYGAGYLVVVGVPVYAGRVPNVLLPWLRGLLAEDGTVAVPVVVYGNRDFDDALVELRDILEAGNFRTVGAGAFVGEHAFSRTLAAGRPDADDLGLARAFAARVAEKLRGPMPVEPVAVDGVPQPYRGYYRPVGAQGEHIDIRKVKPETAESCTRCGLCAEICPMGSIVPEDVRSYRGICIKCGACVKRCPVGAKRITDPGYLFHKEDLERTYGGRRGAVSTFI